MGLPLTHKPTIIPTDAVEISRGLWTWELNEMSVYFVTLAADPLKDDEDWLERETANIPRLEREREYLGEFTGFAGKPVYPEYQDRLHHSTKPLLYVPNRPIIRGWDVPGPLACVWFQLIPVMRPEQSIREAGALRCHVLAELYMDCGVEEFGRQVLQETSMQFPQASSFIEWADPQAFTKAANDKRSAADELRTACQIYLQPGAMDLTARTTGVRRWLTRLCPGAKSTEPPGLLLLDPSCVMLRDGFKGGYFFTEIEKTGRYREIPTKNEFSHLMNALEYGLTRCLPLAEEEKEPEPLQFADYLGRI